MRSLFASGCWTWLRTRLASVARYLAACGNPFRRVRAPIDDHTQQAYQCDQEKIRSGGMS